VALIKGPLQQTRSSKAERYKTKQLKRLNRRAFASLLIRKRRKTAYKSLPAKVKTKTLLLARCPLFK
jgi:hypothetical protein